MSWRGRQTRTTIMRKVHPVDWVGGQVDKWAGEWVGLRQRRKEEGWVVVEESGVR